MSKMINYDELALAWKNVSEKYSEQPRLQRTLNSADLFIYKDNWILFSVVNQAQKEWIRTHVLNNIQDQIREELNDVTAILEVLTSEELNALRACHIIRSSWKSEDLKMICALSNTDGGMITYHYPAEERDLINRQLKLIQNKRKKIGPSNSHILVESKEIRSNCYIAVTVLPSESICYISSRSGIESYYLYVNGKVILAEKDEIERINSIRKKKVAKKYISKITSMMIIPDAEFIENHKFNNGESVPIFEALSVYGFNRLVGYLKYINRTYANVYSRGECKLHPSLIPSLYRNKTDLLVEDNKIKTIINRFIKDPKLSQKLSLNPFDNDSRYVVEGVLQHYGATTSFLDVVDNHWVALWMGLNEYTVKEQLDKYARYIERSIPIIEKLIEDPLHKNKNMWEEKLYQYVLLVAVPFAVNQSEKGISISDSIIEVDLRKALPSTFLRPHAQHGLVIKRNITAKVATANDFDLSSNVVAIIRVRIDRAKKWIGDGELLTQDNLIPPPGYDPGYDLLLQRSDLFQNSSLKIMKYE